MVPLTVLFVSHDADGSASGIIGPRKSCCTLFLSSWSIRYNVAIYDVVKYHVTLTLIPMVACDTNTNGSCVT